MKGEGKVSESSKMKRSQHRAGWRAKSGDAKRRLADEVETETRGEGRDGKGR